MQLWINDVLKPDLVFVTELESVWSIGATELVLWPAYGNNKTNDYIKAN